MNPFERANLAITIVASLRKMGYTVLSYCDISGDETYSITCINPNGEVQFNKSGFETYSESVIAMGEHINKLLKADEILKGETS